MKPLEDRMDTKSETEPVYRPSGKRKKWAKLLQANQSPITCVSSVEKKQASGLGPGVQCECCFCNDRLMAVAGRTQRHQQKTTSEIITPTLFSAACDRARNKNHNPTKPTPRPSPLHSMCRRPLVVWFSRPRTQHLQASTPG